MHTSPMTTGATTPTLPIGADPAGVAYHHTLRAAPGGRLWRGLIAIVATVLIYLLISIVLGMAAMLLDRITGTQDLSTGSMADLRLTPAVLLATNLTAAVMIPIVLGLERALYGRSVAGGLHSVAGRVRWRWLLRLAAVLLLPFVGYAAVSQLVLPTPGGSGPAPHWIALLVIVVLTTPLQAAGEEYVCRGFLQRAVGAWFPAPRVGFVVATVITSVLFMIAHGAGDPWLIGYYLVFGATMAVVGWQTGGLEAPVAIHGLNNLVMFLATILFTDTAGSFDRSAGAGGPYMIVAMVVIMVVGAVAVLLGRRLRIARVTGARTV